MNKRVIAIDYGRKRIGVAASDELLITASPNAVVKANEDGSLPKDLISLIEELDPYIVLVGHPLNMDGTRGPMASEAESFAAKIRERFPGREIRLVDERLTSREAERGLIAQGKRRSERKELRDAIAATILLRTHLDLIKREGESGV